MRRTVAVALLLVLAGCNAFPAGGGSEPADTRTLTPVDVPTAESLRTPTPQPSTCLAPRVAPAERTPAPTPATAVALAPKGDTVRGPTLVARHRGTLVNYSFSLRVGTTEVTAMPGASAFTYEGVSLGFGSVRVFAVAGTMYRLHETDDGVRVSETPYRPEATETDWYLDALTGSDWLAERVAPYNYTQVDTRTWNGTEVRVLEDNFDGQGLIGPGEALSVNTTVYVDRRGIVRYVRQVRTISRDEGDEVVRTREIETFTVTDVGTATVSRPAAFCVPNDEVATPTRTRDPSAVADPSNTPNATAGPFTAVPGTETATVVVTVNGSADTASGRTLTFRDAGATNATAATPSD